MKAPIKWPVWPKYDDAHEKAVLRVIRSNQLFAAQEVKAFEQEFAGYVGSAHAIGLGNATQGLHLALAALGVGTGDEVIVTPYSWISSASCVLMQNAIPVFVDIEPESFGICPEALRRAISPRTRAVILVHMFGLASRVKDILDICEESSIYLIEDASHSHGARQDGKHLGTFGTLGVFSLHQRKAISTGDGGIVCTNRDEVAYKLSRLRSFGHDQLSYNYRMNEFAAALGRIGLERLDDENKRRIQNHIILSEHLRGTKARVIEAREGVSPVFYSNLLDISLPIAQQDALLAQANSEGIPLRRTWQPLNLHPHFRREHMPNGIAPWDFLDTQYDEPSRCDLPISDRFQRTRLFELDCHPLVSPESVIEATSRLKTILG